MGKFEKKIEREMRHERKSIEALAGALIIFVSMIYLGIIAVVKTTTFSITTSTTFLGAVGIVLGLIVLILAFRK
jgi:beta-lactamase regulating signal transducer with metallopeptidase domain